MDRTISCYFVNSDRSYNYMLYNFNEDNGISYTKSNLTLWFSKNINKMQVKHDTSMYLHVYNETPKMPFVKMCNVMLTYFKYLTEFICTFSLVSYTRI